MSSAINASALSSLSSPANRAQQDLQAAGTFQQAAAKGLNPNGQPVAPPPPPPGPAPNLPRPLLAGGGSDRNNDQTQGSGGASSTPTISTYGATAVTAPNGASGGSLDLLA